MKNVHSNSKSYICDTCFDVFQTSSGLKKHKISSHENNKTFECDKCDKGFNFKLNLNNHIKRMHSTVEADEGKNKCNTCNKKFLNGTFLKAHKENFH